MKWYHRIMNVVMGASVTACFLHFSNKKGFWAAFPTWLLLLPVFIYFGLIIIALLANAFKREIALSYVYIRYFRDKKIWEEAKRWYKIGKRCDKLGDKIDSYNEALRRCK